MANTRKILERVPDEKLSWKPHEKSMSLGRLAGHVAELSSWATHTVALESLDITPRDGDTPESFTATSRAELLERFDKNVAEAREAIAGTTDDHLAHIWSLYLNGQTLLSMPRRDVLRFVVMNHLVHHRAQLGVYLRLNGIPVPGMYGPSADEL
jgi:uncharacterized damage-inducible protein DinB